MGPLPITTRTFGNTGFLGRQVPLAGMGAPAPTPRRMGQVSPEITANLKEAERLVQSSLKAFPKLVALIGEESAQGTLDQAQANYQEALEAYKAAGGT